MRAPAPGCSRIRAPRSRSTPSPVTACCMGWTSSATCAASCPRSSASRRVDPHEHCRMQALIAVLAGDGIGAEVTQEAVRVLERVAERGGHAFRFEPALIGGAAIDETGEALPAATLELCRRAD